VAGKHPFGDTGIRVHNIQNGVSDVSSIRRSSGFDAMDLVTRMIHPDSSRRPRAAQVMAHPYLWPANRKLDFMTEFSQRVFDKEEAVQLDGILDRARASDGSPLVGHSWDRNLDVKLLEDLATSGVKYIFTSASHCVKMIRNKRTHRGENKDLAHFLLDDNDWFAYIDSLFPELFMKCVSIACTQLHEAEPVFLKYCKDIAGMFRENVDDAAHHGADGYGDDEDDDDDDGSDDGGGNSGVSWRTPASTLRKEASPAAAKKSSKGAGKKGAAAPPANNYKTKMCTNNPCPFAAKDGGCHFAHSKEEQRQARAKQAADKKRSAAAGAPGRSSDGGSKDNWRNQK
jgi:hypothetical protein